MKSTFYNEEQSVKSAPKKLADMLSFNSCDLLIELSKTKIR